MNVFRDDALKNFRNQEYREAYWDEFLKVWIATQIKALREQRGWTQKDLAEKAGMKQSRISALENLTYENWSVNTLKRLAKAFGVTLAVEFRGYGKRIIDFERFERRDLEEPEFAKDPAFRDATAERRIQLGGQICGTSNVLAGAPEGEGEPPDLLTANDRDEVAA